MSLVKVKTDFRQLLPLLLKNKKISSRTDNYVNVPEENIASLIKRLSVYVNCRDLRNQTLEITDIYTNNTVILDRNFNLYIDGSLVFQNNEQADLVAYVFSKYDNFFLSDNLYDTRKAKELTASLNTIINEIIKEESPKEDASKEEQEESSKEEASKEEQKESSKDVNQVDITNDAFKDLLGDLYEEPVPEEAVPETIPEEAVPEEPVPETIPEEPVPETIQEEPVPETIQETIPETKKKSSSTHIDIFDFLQEHAISQSENIGEYIIKIESKHLPYLSEFFNTYNQKESHERLKYKIKYEIRHNEDPSFRIIKVESTVDKSSKYIPNKEESKEIERIKNNDDELLKYLTKF